MKRVVIVGIGLIGGSIALALREFFPEIELIGVDDEVVLQAAPVRALFSQWASTQSRDYSFFRKLGADLIVLATPVGSISETVATWLELGVPVTDCGSTKQVIAASANQSPLRHWFVPGHPMAGRERGGFASASADLFRGRTWIVCPQQSSPAALAPVRALVSAVGGIITEMTPESHDLAVALTSHVPQLLASWLAASCTETQRPATGPAFADMTRIAGGSEHMWRDIFESNAAPIAAIARNLSRDFIEIAEELECSAPRLDRVLRLLAAARGRSTP
jgi:prephenate dehydrogenase